MDRRILYVLVGLTVVLQFGAGPAMAQESDPDVAVTLDDKVQIEPGECNGAVDYLCTCQEGQADCDSGEECTTFVINRCVVG